MLFTMINKLWTVFSLDEAVSGISNDGIYYDECSFTIRGVGKKTRFVIMPIVILIIPFLPKPYPFVLPVFLFSLFMSAIGAILWAISSTPYQIEQRFNKWK